MAVGMEHEEMEMGKGERGGGREAGGGRGKGWLMLFNDTWSQ